MEYRVLSFESIVAPNVPNFIYNTYPTIEWCVDSKYFLKI